MKKETGSHIAIEKNITKDDSNGEKQEEEKPRETYSIQYKRKRGQELAVTCTNFKRKNKPVKSAE